MDQLTGCCVRPHRPGSRGINAAVGSACCGLSTANSPILRARSPRWCPRTLVQPVQNRAANPSKRKRMMRRNFARLSTFVTLLLLCASAIHCGGDPFEDPPPKKESPTKTSDEPAKTPQPASTPPPAPPSAGDLCPTGECEGKSICIGGICYAKCMQASPSCNDIVPACPSGQACLGATSFTDACFPTGARTGELCGPAADGAICRSGNLCVALKDAQPRCLKLCKYNCPAERCVQTQNGCGVCLP